MLEYNCTEFPVGVEGREDPIYVLLEAYGYDRRPTSRRWTYCAGDRRRWQGVQPDRKMRPTAPRNGFRKCDCGAVQLDHDITEDTVTFNFLALPYRVGVGLGVKRGTYWYSLVPKLSTGALFMNALRPTLFFAMVIFLLDITSSTIPSELPVATVRRFPNLAGSIVHHERQWSAERTQG